MLEDLLALCCLPGPTVTVLLVPKESYEHVLMSLALTLDSFMGRTALMGNGNRMTVLPASTLLSPWDVAGRIPYRLALMGWATADPKDLKGLGQWMTLAAKVCVVGSTRDEIS